MYATYSIVSEKDVYPPWIILGFLRMADVQIGNNSIQVMIGTGHEVYEITGRT
jgi:hypothetical protein